MKSHLPPRVNAQKRGCVNRVYSPPCKQGLAYETVLTNEPAYALPHSLFFFTAESKWEELHPAGERPPALQEHSAVAYKDCLYVFGGELGFSAGTETPLWVYNVKVTYQLQSKAAFSLVNIY